MKLVYVEWVDSSRGANQWSAASDSAAQTTADLLCASVGWLLHDIKDSITLVQTITDGGEQILFRLHIPRRAILKMRRLK